jgi:hypothetical protein
MISAKEGIVELEPGRSGSAADLIVDVAFSAGHETG